MHLSTFPERACLRESLPKSTDSYHIFAPICFECVSLSAAHTIYLITVDNWCAAFTINYGSTESLEILEFFSCPLCCFALLRFSVSPFSPSLSASCHETIVLRFRQLQIEFKRLFGRLFYGNCAPNDINFSLLHRFNIHGTTKRGTSSSSEERSAKAHQFKLTMIIGFSSSCWWLEGFIYSAPCAHPPQRRVCVARFSLHPLSNTSASDNTAWSRFRVKNCTVFFSLRRRVSLQRNGCFSIFF